MGSLRMPITVASRTGISGVTTAAEGQRVVLTNHGRAVAVVDSAERIDDDLRRLREASIAVLDAASNLVSQRSTTLDLDDVCTRLGLNADTVRSRVADRRSLAS